MSMATPRPFTVTLDRDPTGDLRAARIGVPLVDQYLTYLASIGRAPTTWSSYAYDLAVFCRWLADQQPAAAIDAALCGLATAEVFAFIEHAGARGDRDGRPPLAPATVARRLVALARFFDWAEALGLVDRNPVPRERPRRLLDRRRGGRLAVGRVPTPLPRPAPADDIAAFTATLRSWRDRALVGLLVGAGLRLAEALGLRLGDLDWGGKQVVVRRGKGGRPRAAMVPDPAWAALKAYLETEWPEPSAMTPAAVAESPLFVVLHGPRRGRPLTAAGVQSLFRHHRRRANTTAVTPHRLRHTCATELHRAGLPLELLQEQLGHRRLESTRLYVHLGNDRLRAAYLAVQHQLAADRAALAGEVR
jgi:integrase